MLPSKTVPEWVRFLPTVAAKYLNAYAFQFSVFYGGIQLLSNGLVRRESVELAFSFVDVGKAYGGLVLFCFWNLLFLCHMEIISNLLSSVT